MQPQLTKKGMKKTTILSIDQKMNQSNMPKKKQRKKTKTNTTKEQNISII